MAYVYVITGFAGVGKSLLTSRLLSHFRSQKKKVLSVNLDPAVDTLPYEVDLDVRNFVDYEELMNEHGLGPNGASVTAINLFSIEFQRVVQHFDEEIVLIDTPGQFEVFSWSAGGSFIAKALNGHSVVMVSVIDGTGESMSALVGSLLFACSTLYRHGHPLVIAVNKHDAGNGAARFLKNYEELHHDICCGNEMYDEVGYSIFCMIEEFIRRIPSFEVSSSTGSGIEEFVRGCEETINKGVNWQCENKISNKTEEITEQLERGVDLNDGDA